jgi:hypothetical protein
VLEIIIFGYYYLQYERFCFEKRTQIPKGLECISYNLVIMNTKAWYLYLEQLLNGGAKFELETSDWKPKWAGDPCTGGFTSVASKSFSLDYYYYYYYYY